ncbi:steroid delta-isomerase [Skermania sp. ID1734]|uniref:nuclear transport factor 2 family protein n=1 Tax=Skermania sp. ID1734 TaxID=2597516 RepID=UPI00117F2CBE|nr:nuclear transport factor 2 family protein [Skermania sp. ID1734]TSD95146.1 steroid delta-isomerase [Skermania sp. ID1734]
MPSIAEIRSAVARYVATVGTGTSADIAALYADDATLEDPVGSPPHVGREAIEKFYSQLDAVRNTTELLTVRVAGNTAAFLFRVVTDTGDQRISIEPIDVMTFDEQARITSMRAFWSPDDVTLT